MFGEFCLPPTSVLPSSHLNSLPPTVHFGLPSGLCYSQPIDGTVCNQVQVQDTHIRLPHSSANRPQCFSACCRRRHIIVAAPPSSPPTPTSASLTHANRPPCCSTRCRRLHSTAAAPPSPPPTPTSVSLTPEQPTALRVSQHAAAASTPRPSHLSARHRHF